MSLSPALATSAKKYDGCYSLLYDDTVRIAADGSTVIDIKYDRRYYLLNFDLDGGYGVEPIYARFGAPVSVGTPAKAGYIFAGWDKELPGDCARAQRQVHGHVERGIRPASPSFSGTRTPTPRQTAHINTASPERINRQTSTPARR